MDPNNARPIVAPEDADGVCVSWAHDDAGQDWIVATIDGREMARRAFHRNVAGGFRTAVRPFAEICLLDNVFKVGRALDLAERRLRD